jgi:hypothetical protein
LWREVDEVEDGVDAVGIVLAHGRVEVGVAVEDFGDAEVTQVVLVFGERGRDQISPRLGGELDEEAADAAAGAAVELSAALMRD